MPFASKAGYINHECDKCEAKAEEMLSKKTEDSPNVRKGDGIVMSYEFQIFQQGWQCPVCKRVYSPTTQMCLYCGNGVVTTSGSTTVGDAMIDWLHHDSITKTEEPQEGR